MDSNEYRQRDAKYEEEVNAITYYISEYYSFKEVPDAEYNTRFREVVKSNNELSPAAKHYILTVTLGE